MGSALPLVGTRVERGGQLFVIGHFSLCALQCALITSLRELMAAPEEGLSYFNLPLGHGGIDVAQRKEASYHLAG